jgi:TetR/AcrR family transcriptional regulator, tetracycline repressor protein
MKQEERRAKQLARLEHMQEYTQQRLDKQRSRMDERFAHARQRLMADEAHPNDDQQRIITAALALLDEVGLNDLSLRKLATKLDRKAPALYWHFENKEALIDYMAEAILQAEFHDLAPRQDDKPWQDWLVHICSRLRHAMCTHRDGARVVAGAHLYPAITLIRLLEVSMQSLMSAGIEMQHANLIITTAIHFVFGNVIEEQSMPSLEEIERMDLQALNEQYPLFAKSVEQSLEAAKRGYDEFEDALRLIVGFNEK